MEHSNGVNGINGTNSTIGLDNLSLVLHKIGDLRLQQTPIPKLGPNDCLLQTHSCGICGTDIHLWDEGHLLDFVLKDPLVIGHEISATVVEVGENVTHLNIGDRVAVEPAVSCLWCDVCREGRYNLCDYSNTHSRGLPPMDGCLRRYFTHPSEFCYKLADNMTMEEGAMMEPFAVIVHAMRRTDIAVGSNVLVCGAGTMGMMAFLAAKAFGANKVFITDVNQHRLDLAKKLGADGTYLIDPSDFDDFKFAQRIKKDMGGAPEVSFECSGSESSTSMAIYATKNGGKVAIVGLGANKIKVPIVFTAMREIDIIGICRFKDDFPLAIQLVSSGKVNIKPLVTHRFKIENALQAFELMKKATENSLKIMIQY